jgi:hypothetical protein
MMKPRNLMVTLAAIAQLAAAGCSCAPPAGTEPNGRPQDTYEMVRALGFEVDRVSYKSGLEGTIDISYANSAMSIPVRASYLYPSIVQNRTGENNITINHLPVPQERLLPFGAGELDPGSPTYDPRKREEAVALLLSSPSFQAYMGGQNPQQRRIAPGELSFTFEDLPGEVRTLEDVVSSVSAMQVRAKDAAFDGWSRSEIPKTEARAEDSDGFTVIYGSSGTPGTAKPIGVLVNYTRG